MYCKLCENFSSFFSKIRKRRRAHFLCCFRLFSEIPNSLFFLKLTNLSLENNKIISLNNVTKNLNFTSKVSLRLNEISNDEIKKIRKKLPNAELIFTETDLKEGVIEYETPNKQK